MSDDRYLPNIEHRHILLVMGLREEEAIKYLEDALRAVGAETERPPVRDRMADLVLTLGDRKVWIEVKRAALVSDAAHWARQIHVPSPDRPTINVVVADRVGQSAREWLQGAGWGWLDLRGSLHLQAPGVLIDTRVPAAWERPSPKDPLSSPAGLEVACALLSEPTTSHAVRGLARQLDRSAGTVSEILKSFRNEGLVEGTANKPAAQLFWRVADVWPGDRVTLAGRPREGAGPVNEALEIGFGDVQGASGWALTDTLAAAAYGAPVAARADQTPDYFVPSAAILARARTLLGVASSPHEVQSTARVAPVPDVCARRINAPTTSSDERPLAAPLYVALDLALDAGRGREILAAWDPPKGWTRVW